MSADIDDLIDGDSDAAEVAARRRVDLYAGDREKNYDEESDIGVDLTDVHAGVTIDWLASVFGMATRTVKKRLAGLQPMKRHRNGVLYDLRLAAAHLVDPLIDVDKFVKTLRPEDLPPKLTKDYWDAMLKRRKYELLAGELWVTADVLEVFGDAFKHIKDSTQLWINTIERTSEMTEKQRKTLVTLADQLLADIHAKLVTMPDHKCTASILEAKAIESTAGEAAEPAAAPVEPAKRGPGRPRKHG